MRQLEEQKKDNLALALSDQSKLHAKIYAKSLWKHVYKIIFN